MNVFIIAALSADGFIAQDPKAPSTSWTSKEDKQWFNQKTKEAGVVVMGRKTYETIDERWRPLPNRINVIYSKNPKSQYPISKQLQIPNNKLPIYTLLEPDQLLRELEKQGYNSVAICGGSSIYTMFMNSGLVNKLYLTIEPVMFGEGVKLLNGKWQMTNGKLKLVEIHRLSDQTIVLEYDLIH